MARQRRFGVGSALIAAAACLTLGTPPTVTASDVSVLDPAFASGGVLRGQAGTFEPALTVTSDGSILFGAKEDSYDVFHRYSADGVFDAAFAPASTTPGALRGVVYSGIQVDSASRLLVAGLSTMDPRIVRYLPNGEVDPAFNLAPRSEYFSSFLVLPNDGVIAVTAQASHSQLVRFLPTGALDVSFNSGGPEPGALELPGLEATDIALQADGAVIVAGRSANRGTVIRVTAAGALDASFQTGAVFASSAIVWSVAVDSAGRLLAAGPNHGYSTNTEVHRLLPSGDPDVSFGSSGRATLPTGGAGVHLAVDGAGRVLLAGNTPTAEAALFRLLPNGAADPSFTDGGVPAGRVLVDVGTLPSSLTTAVPLADGRILVAGHEELSPGEGQPFVARVIANTGATTGAGFNPVPPNRILDTRNGVGAPTGKLTPGNQLHLTVTGTPNIPTTGVTAVTMNVTVAAPDAAGYATVFPCNITQPIVSNLNFAAGQDVPNLVTVPVAPDGTICITTSATTHLLADIAGWYGITGAGFNPVSPNRILDTRNGIGGTSSKLFPGEVRQLRVAGTPNVPAKGATAATLNVTVTQPQAAGYVTVYPCDIAAPTVSNLNFAPGHDVANLVSIPLPHFDEWDEREGAICFTSSAPVDLLADVAGWFGTTGAGFNPVPPNRILDTRNGVGAPTGKLTPGNQLHLTVTGTPNIPTTGVTAVTMNVTVAAPDAAGYATVFPCNITQPIVSNLNFAAGQDVPNLVTVPIAPDGTICITTSATTHLLADIAGWYSDS